ncbi:alcohol dehydrogenase [Colletotrichum scovillei]|uniref:Alcohol dehydrogenase n=1 Tax=Colletotrichum scovillei TaxID=1209932 RepID=A0A9P7QU33_9PEZI|nr:alcohol dehydrogenase [Colletotrichum scovillei]KAG7041148.1 alcohol dehydrogenase [Colletotrichum scovillei]KAG7061180.1 alcohol dehydrogenase [Colletotrichum scovillei]
MACLDVRQTLIQQLKGQDLRIPDLSLLFKPWPKDASPCLEGLRTLSGERVASFTELPKSRNSMSKIDVGLFISTWYPGVNLERGDILRCVVLWLFTWDDQIDEKGGHLYDNLEAAHVFRRETLEYVRYCLRLSSDNEASHEVPTNYIIAFFKVIGDAVCEAYDYDHRELLFDEIKFFIETSETEQQRRLGPELPSTREYIATRMGTGAVNVCLFFIDYACGVSVPIEALREVEMRTLWDQANILVWAAVTSIHRRDLNTMVQAIPEISRQWKVIGENGLDSLQFSDEKSPEVGDSQVLVKIQGATLNYRDLTITKGTYPWDVRPDVVPGSDGAGTVLAVGKHVTRFKPGDKVVTALAQRYIAGPLSDDLPKSGLGAVLDGTFRTIGVFSEQGLVPLPRGLTFIEGAALTCAGVTAWNALFGLSGKQVSAGQWVLTQGTGGVSIFAIQFAKAVGARVIATTSSAEKAKLLEKLGVDHIINYRETIDWGKEAKRLTGGVGVDLVVEVAGPTTLRQSLVSCRLDGTIITTGFAGGNPSEHDMPTFLDSWLSLVTVRGVWCGSRLQLEEMCRAIEADTDKLRPVIDPKVFNLEQLKEAYEYLQSGKHQGKVGIEVN